MTASQASPGDSAAGAETAGVREAGAQERRRFSSLDAMHAEHRRLLELARSGGLERDTVLAFLETGRGTGTLLDALDDRAQAQGMLDYWTARLYSRPLRDPDAASIPDAVLAEFDIAAVREVAAKAEAAVQALDRRGVETAKHVLLRLVRLIGARRFESLQVDGTALEDLDDDRQRLKRVLMALLEAGALRVVAGEADDTRFSLQYEALIRQWDRLRTWLDQRVRFREAARYGGQLLPGRLLDEAERYHDKEAFEQSFLVASRKRTKKLKAIVYGVGVVIVLVFLFQSYSANRSAYASRELALIAVDPDPQPDGSSLEAAVRAVDIAKTDEAERALHTVLRAPVRIWDAPFSRRAGGFSVSPDGGRLATVQDDGAVQILDTASGMVLDTLPPPPPPQVILVVALSRRHVASLVQNGDTRLLEVWSAPAGQWKPWLSRRIAEDLSIMAFSTDGTTLAIASNSADLALWDVESGREQVLSTHYSGSVQTFAFSADGRYLAISADNGELGLWDASTLTPLRQLVREGISTAPVTSVAFGARGQLATSTAGGATTWSVAQDRATGTIPRSSSACQEVSAVLNVALSADGRYLATAGECGSVKIWLASTGMQVASIPRGRSTVERAVFTPSGDLLLVTVQLTRATAALWNFVVAPALELGTVGHSLRQFAFLGKKALLVRDDTKIWNVFWDRKVRAPRFNEVPSPCSQTGYALAGFSSDGSRVACIGTAAAEMVEVWSTSSPAPSRVFRRPAASVGLVQLSPDGSRLAVVRGASGSREDTAEADIWDIDGGRRLAALPALKGGFEAVAFAPDNASIAIVKHDGTADVWDLGRLRGPRNPPMPERRFVLHHGGVIFALAYNPNPRFPQIATVGDDGLIKLWNSASGESIHTDTKMHEEDVHDVAFSADGRRMATSSTRGQVRLWDTADGRAILVFYGSRYTGIAFSQDGALLAMAADNGLMQLEILDVDWLTKIARERLDDLKKKRQGRAALEP